MSQAIKIIMWTRILNSQCVLIHKNCFCHVLNCLMSYILLMQVDFRIMCENAMIYNKPETIYHKAARKLLHSGMKILSQV